MLKNFLNNLNLKNVKKIFLYSIFIFFIFNSSFACQLLNVPIGSNVTSAAATFDFLDDYNQEAYGENSSAKYEEYAADFCDGSDLKETDLEVIIYQSKIAAINLINSDQENNNLVYEFAKNFIKDPTQSIYQQNAVMSLIAKNLGFSKNLTKHDAKIFMQNIYLGYMYSRWGKIRGLEKMI